MAKLNEFIGAVVSGISNARVNSDLQALQIAQNYASNELLKHFAVPRMRVDKVEVNIPIAINGITNRIQKVFAPIDQDAVFGKTFEIVTKIIDSNKVSSASYTALKTYVYEQVKRLENDLKLKGNETALEDFANRIAVRVTSAINATENPDAQRVITPAELPAYNEKVSYELRKNLAEQIVEVSETTVSDEVDFMVEADKLRDIKPENILMIKMSLTEQGMEWITMENSKGETVSKLMPE